MGDTFETLLLQPEILKLMQTMEIDVTTLIEHVMTLFDTEDTGITPSELTKLMLDLRGTNRCTVKDIVQLRRFMINEMALMTAKLFRQMEDVQVMNRRSSEIT